MGDRPGNTVWPATRRARGVARSGRHASIASVLLASLALARGAAAQDVEPSFALSFGPCPGRVAVPRGSEFWREYVCYVTSAGDPETGAHSWSLSMTAEGVEIVHVTTAGTLGASVDDDPPGLRREPGFVLNELGEGGVDACEGRRSAISAVVLSLRELVTLPPRGASPVARITVRGEAPAEAGEAYAASLFHVDGCAGSG